jgi:GDP-L-fucose synthase
MTGRTFWAGKRVCVTGGGGFIGSAVVAHLRQECGLPAASIVIPRSRDVDLRVPEQAVAAVRGCQVVMHLAAVTGGIGFSRGHPASQYRDSTLIDLNVVEAARLARAEKVVATGNLFAYAANASMPLREEALFDGLPTEAHRGVGWAKRNLAVLADLYRREHKLPMAVVYLANAYGPGDSLDPNYGHVIPATIMKCLHDAELLVWGDGSPTRDFLYVDDTARALVLAAEQLEAGEVLNVGSGTEVSIGDLVRTIAKATQFAGPIRFDATKAGGDARRCADTSRARDRLGFAPRVSLEDGMARTVAWYRTALGNRS